MNNKNIIIDIDLYHELIKMLESDPAKAKEALKRAASPVLRETFYEVHGKMTFGEIASRHMNVNPCRLPILLEAWDVIRPWYNANDKTKSFRYYRVNAGLLNDTYTDESMRGVKKPNDENPADVSPLSLFADADGNIHLMKFFTNAGADYVSKLLVKHGYPRIERVETEGEPEPELPASAPESGKPKITEREIAILVLTLSDTVHLETVIKIALSMKRMFEDEADFSFDPDKLENISSHYVLFDSDNILHRGDKFYDNFNAEFKYGGAFHDETTKDLVDRMSKAISVEMEGWTE